MQKKVLYTILAIWIASASIMAAWSVRVANQKSSRPNTTRNSESVGYSPKPGSYYGGSVPMPETKREPKFYERSTQIVSTKKLILLETYDTDEFERQSIVELKDGKYIPLTDEYKWVNEYIDEDVTGFWFVEDHKRLFLLRFAKEEYRSDSPEFTELVLIDYSDLNNIKQGSLATMKNGIYENKSFLDFIPEKDSFILLTRGGDGCGGWGDISIFNMKNNENKVIKEIGSGCNPKPRYFSYTDDKLMLGDIEACDSSVRFNDDNCLTSIYYTDPFNLEDRTELYKFSKPYFYEQGYSSDINLSDENEILLSKLIRLGDRNGYPRVDSENYILNLDAKSLRLVKN